MEWLNIVFSGLGIFAVLALSLLWSENMEVGLKSVETKLSLFFIPLIVGLNLPIKRSSFTFLIWSFIAGLIVASGMSLSNSFAMCMYENDFSSFFYAKLAGVFHTSYLSMYYVVGVCYLLFRDEKEKLFNGHEWKYLPLALPFLFLLMTAFLSSKAGILTGVVVILLAMIVEWKNARRTKRIWYLLSLLVFLLLSTTLNPSASKRIMVANKTTAAQKPAPEVNPTRRDSVRTTLRSSTETRLVSWGTSWDIMNNNVIGVGAGDVKDQLIASYGDRGEYYVQEKKYNSHNQFLEVGVASGWMGFLFLTFMMLYLMFRAYHMKDWLMFSIVFVIFLNLLTESMFERQSGTVFISLMISLLVFREFKAEPTKIENT